MSARLVLVIGGQRAGKRRYARQIATLDQRVLVITTADAEHADQSTQPAASETVQPSDWQTINAPREIVESIAPMISQYDAVLLDSLASWSANLMRQGEGVDLLGEVDRLNRLISESAATWILVSDEVSSGTLADHDLGQKFVDELGRVNQRIAAIADDVFLMIAGLPLNLKRLS